MQASPVQLHRNMRQALQDAQLAAALAGVKDKFVGKRAKGVARLNQSSDFEALRDYGKQVRDHAVQNMPALLRQFAAAAEAAGAKTLWAKDAAEASRLIGEIAAAHQVKSAVKSKSMASEEIDLNAALQARGVTVTETDLGEFIIQLAGERPSHIIAPAVHKSRAQVSDLFATHLGAQTDNIAELAAAARAHLRRIFFAADMGITGANFLAADTGSAIIVTNEGNGRMSNTLPRVHVALAGIDKIIARAQDIPAMLALLTHSATGQRLSNYVSMTTGARRPGNAGNPSSPDGPEHAYIVLLDNGRSALRQDECRDMLRCIRCGACMNHCPVYHSVGGHAYGAVYMGPMGQVLTPSLHGIETAPDLPFAATLCGACEVVCPVKIPLPTLMRRLRARRARQCAKWPDKLFIRLWSFFALRPAAYAALTAALARAGALLGGRAGRIRRLPGLAGWFAARDLPAPAPRTFRQLMRRHAKKSPPPPAP